MRAYLHGRTECIRPQSVAQTRFLRAFDAPKHERMPSQQLADLVRAAGDAHRNYTRDAMAGKGVDRHLMGLRIIAMENGIPLHPLFADKAYKLSSSFTLSTSQMPWAVEDWPGFGAYDPNCYGVCYRFSKANTIVATVTSRRVTNGGRKDAKRFSEAIKQALRDVMALLAANPPSPDADKQAKL
jgi:carnitine O-acetyltransferase